MARSHRPSPSRRVYRLPLDAWRCLERRERTECRGEHTRTVMTERVSIVGSSASCGRLRQKRGRCDRSAVSSRSTSPCANVQRQTYQIHPFFYPSILQRLHIYGEVGKGVSETDVFDVLVPSFFSNPRSTLLLSLAFLPSNVV